MKFRDLITWCNISYQPICNERDTWKFGVTTIVEGPLISEVSRRNCNFYVFYLFFVCRCHLTWKSKNNSSSLIIRSYDTGTIQNTRSYSRKQLLWNACIFLGMRYEKTKRKFSWKCHLYWEKQNVQLKRSIEKELLKGCWKINRTLLRVVNYGLFPSFPRRGAHIAANMIASNKDIATKVSKL